VNDFDARASSFPPPARARTVIVTGANRGIGLGVARGLARKGHRALLACRDGAAAAAARDEIAADPLVRAAGGRVELAPPLDLGSLGSVRVFAESAARDGGPIDALVNNAGVLCPSREETADGFERCLGVNFLGPFLLARLMIPRIAPGGRIVNTSSVAGLFGRFDPADLAMAEHYHPLRAYARSKLASILATLELARRLEGRVLVNAVHPGVVNTRILSMGRWFDPLADLLFRPLIRGIDSGAAPIAELAVSPSMEGVTGAYFSRFRRLRLPGRLADPEARRGLWDMASDLVGLPRDIGV
jgi:NAD(P)-dependent dehydrogenase (short-subunit alcohol dehydrogenase family)